MRRLLSRLITRRDPAEVQTPFQMGSHTQEE